jgi:hypothetical protein
MAHSPPIQPTNTPSLPPVVTPILSLRFPLAQYYYTDGSFTPPDGPDGEGKYNIARAEVFNGPLQVNITTHLLGFPTILKA